MGEQLKEPDSGNLFIMLKRWKKLKSKLAIELEPED